MDFLFWGEGLVQALGYLGVFFVVLVFSLGLTLPMPTSGLVIFAGALLNPLFVGFVAAVASTIGESVAFGLGLSGRTVLKGRQKALKKVRRQLEKRPYLLPLVALLPFPSMVVGVSAGLLQYRSLHFVFSIFLGRLVKMFVYAFVGYYGWSLLQTL